ncbi:MAG: hypothetical protein MK312_02290 [Roseibacillus sp.]|nr:hypothetical protein [Roseibacillus sp.]
MNRLLLPGIFLLGTALMSSCVYDPYASSYRGHNHSHYHGGYHHGFFSDYYIGVHNNYYRYRHTRCSHCSHYPCSGGHRTSYRTYYRDYKKPLHASTRSPYDQGNSTRSDRRMGDYGKPYSGSIKEAPRSYRPESRMPLSSSDSKIPRGASAANLKQPPISSRSLNSPKLTPKAYPPSQSRPSKFSSDSRPSHNRPDRTARSAPSSSSKTSSKTQEAPSKKD